MSENNGSIEVLKAIQGLPLLESNFQSCQLLTILACRRRKIDNKPSACLEDYLLPEKAVQIYQRIVSEPLVMPPNKILSPANQKKLSEAIDYIKALFPEWRILFEVPIRFMGLVNNQASLSNRLIPQYIFLGDSAFNCMVNLQEIIVHELSHIWCGFISEIFDFQRPDSPTNFTLPSGTTNRSVAIVFLAALFAASAITFYQRFNKKETSLKTIERVDYLRLYLKGCIDLLDDRKYTSTMGNLILDRLISFNLHSQPKDVFYA